MEFMIQVTNDLGVPFNVVSERKEQGNTVRIHDARRANLESIGQFVSSYYVKTLKEMSPDAGLMLYASVEAWRLTAENVQTIISRFAE